MKNLVVSTLEGKKIASVIYNVENLNKVTSIDDVEALTSLAGEGVRGKLEGEQAVMVYLEVFEKDGDRDIIDSRKLYWGGDVRNEIREILDFPLFSAEEKLDKIWNLI